MKDPIPGDPGDPADSAPGPVRPAPPAPAPSSPPPPWSGMNSGFTGTYENGQLANPFDYGTVGGIDPTSLFQQYSSQPYSAVPAPTGSGGSAPAAGGEIPQLRMVAGTSPPYLPETPSGDTSQSQNPAYATTTFDAGSFKGAHNTMISATAEVVALYKDLRSLVLSTSDWAFGQNAVVEVPAVIQHSEPGSHSTADMDTQGPIYTPASYEPDPALFGDPSSDPNTFAGTPGHPGMNDAQADTLVMIADGIELVGQFLGMMQSTGIAYASADANSAAPPSETS
jgi:hypothetical protein